MAKNAMVSEELAKKFATEKDTPYTRWVRDEGLNIISAHYVPNLHTVELKPWSRRGGRGVFINHEASRTSNDCYVCEIPCAQKLAPQRQLYEEMVLILDGRGSTTVWTDAGQRVSFARSRSCLIPPTISRAVFLANPTILATRGSKKAFCWIRILCPTQ